jgi:hypothetical protein
MRTQIFNQESNAIKEEATLSVKKTIISLDGQLWQGLDTNCAGFYALVVELKEMQESNSNSK